mmetsp:Transcript_4588/g.9204  ORF Transcript_4588/g.9204 Transcript_4588/m.9204 type:complete len:244 (+) Transcript_4588:169-900(+)
MCGRGGTDPLVSHFMAALSLSVPILTFFLVYKEAAGTAAGRGQWGVLLPEVVCPFLLLHMLPVGGLSADPSLGSALFFFNRGAEEYPEPPSGGSLRRVCAVSPLVQCSVAVRARAHFRSLRGGGSGGCSTDWREEERQGEGQRGRISAEPIRRGGNRERGVPHRGIGVRQCLVTRLPYWRVRYLRCLLGAVPSNSEETSDGVEFVCAQVDVRLSPDGLGGLHGALGHVLGSTLTPGLKQAELS